MINTTNGTAGQMINRRIDPALDRRRLVLFFAGLIAFYVGVLLVTQPELNGGEAELDKFVLGVMLAPTVGAILACVFGPGVIRFGLPSWWLLAAFLPAVVVFLITMVTAPVTDAVTFHSEQVGALLLMAVVQSLLLSIFALGEEIGWRGFLWPLMRRRLTFIASTAIMAAVWWIYHAGLTFAGWYGFNGGIPAFSVALLGFVLFVGVLTERSRSVWPSVLAHGSWNALVASYFSSSGAAEDRVSPGAGICSVSSAGWGRRACSFLASGSCGGIFAPRPRTACHRRSRQAMSRQPCGCGSAIHPSSRHLPPQGDSTSGRKCNAHLVTQGFQAGRDIVADAAYVLYGLSDGVGNWPVHVSAPGVDRAGVSAPHRDHEVRSPHDLLG
jgi:membrane protease YdiL (CAAX protease family)